MKKYFKKIELIVYDFDGVMTDNRVMIDRFGNEYVFVNRSDGLAVSELKRMGIRQIIISTEKNGVVGKRARKIKISCLQGVSNKQKALKKYLAKYKIDKKNVMFIGNDINDLDVMKYVGYPVAPKDADPKIKKIAKIVTDKKGGCGVIREILDIISGEKGI